MSTPAADPGSPPPTTAGPPVGPRPAARGAGRGLLLITAAKLWFMVGGRGAGRGLLLITAAKLWFMVGGAALSLLLPRMFGRDESAARYGEWGAVLACMSVLNNVVITGTILAVARFASRGPEWVEGTKRVALRVNAAVIAVVAAGYFLSAPLIAGFVKNPGIESALRASTGVILCYGFYPVFVGAANGAQEFHKQAGLDIAFTTLRATLVLTAAALFGTVLAAISGFVVAAATVLLLSIFVVGRRPLSLAPRAGELLAFAAPVAGYLDVQNLLMFVDLWLVERYVAVAAERAGSAAAASTLLASKAVGAYNAALQIARLPYQATIAVTFVVFPLVAQATFVADAARTRDYIRKAIRLSLLVVVGAAAAAATRPDSIFLLLFPRNAAGVNEYLVGAPALPPLMFAYAAFSLLSISGTILNGAGASLATLAIGAATLALDVGANFAAITWALDGGRPPLPAAAAATALSMVAGLGLSLAYLQRRLGASLPPLTAVRALAAAALAVLAGRALPLPGRAGLVSCALAGLVYGLALLGSGELSLGPLLRRLRHR